MIACSYTVVEEFGVPEFRVSYGTFLSGSDPDRSGRELAQSNFQKKETSKARRRSQNSWHLFII